MIVIIHGAIAQCSAVYTVLQSIDKMRPGINHYDCHAEIETKHTVVSGKLVAHISLQLSTRDDAGRI